MSESENDSSGLKYEFREGNNGGTSVQNLPA